jgi:hypothetical protein
MELPAKFRASSPNPPAPIGDASFDRHGRQWASLQLIIEALFLLGLGTGDVEKYEFPGELGVLALEQSGGMPYLVVMDAE